MKAIVKISKILVCSSVSFYFISCKKMSAQHSSSSSSTIKKDEKDAISLKMEAFVKHIQANMISKVQELEGPLGSKFTVDEWTRAEGGYGSTAVLQNSTIFEKAGVNYSVISSNAPKPMLEQMRARKPLNISDNENYKMFVAGVSMVMHPHNPMAPTFHANYRYFELRTENSDLDSDPVCWWYL
jgi:coproporphyrinogen III oxidase